jgi:hypothetical protein
MATFDGHLSLVPSWNDGDTVNPAMGDLDIPTWDEGWMAPTGDDFGSLDDNQPVTQTHTYSHVGHISDLYAFLHWYNRIHIQYSNFNLGNVVGDQEITFWILNTFLIPQELAAINEFGVEGLELIAPQTVPFDIQPFEQLEFTLLIDATGPPTISAEFEFEFPGFQDLTLIVEGIRVVGWMWEPNWVADIRERLTWQSELLESYNGTPQAIQYREYPKLALEFTVDADRRLARMMENTLYAWNSRTWALPYFPHVSSLEIDVLQGASFAPIETEGKSFQVDGLAMFINENTYETAEIESIDPSSLNFKRGLAKAWPVGTRIYPVIFSRLASTFGFSRFNQNYNYGTVLFESTQGVPHDSEVETLYRGYPILTRMPEWNTDPTSAYQDKVEVIDNPLGMTSVELESETPTTFFSWNWQCFGSTEIDALKKFLYARRGRVRAVWIPTFVDDLVLTDTIGPSGLTVQVEFANLVQFLDDDSINRRDIRIELNNGTVFYRRVSDFTPVDDDNETFSIDSLLGVTVTPADVFRISWMQLMRLDSDTIELLWSSPTVVGVQLPFRGSHDDV